MDARSIPEASGEWVTCRRVSADATVRAATSSRWSALRNVSASPLVQLLDPHLAEVLGQQQRQVVGGQARPPGRRARRDLLHPRWTAPRRVRLRGGRVGDGDACRGRWRTVGAGRCSGTSAAGRPVRLVVVVSSSSARASGSSSGSSSSGASSSCHSSSASASSSSSGRRLGGARAGRAAQAGVERQEGGAQLVGAGRHDGVQVGLARVEPVRDRQRQVGRLLVSRSLFFVSPLARPRASVRCVGWDISLSFLFSARWHRLGGPGPQAPDTSRAPLL